MEIGYAGCAEGLIDGDDVLLSGLDQADEALRTDEDRALDSIQRTLADAESRQWAANREQALIVVAVGETIAIARRHPLIYVPHRIHDSVAGREAVSFSERAAIFDLAARMHLSEQTVRSHVQIAEMLEMRLPRLQQEFLAGVAPYLHVRSAVEACSQLTDATAVAVYDETLADAVGRMTPGAFGRKARKLAERLSRESSEKRHLRAHDERRVEFEPVSDGMAWLHLYIDAIDAVRINARLAGTATRMRHEKGQIRSKAQLEADAAVAWLAGDGTATAALVRPYLVVDGDGNGDLQGYGAIDQRATAGALRGAPSFRRLFTDPVRPTRLTVDRATYRPSRAQREWLTLRFGLDPDSADFVSTDAEIDHVIERQDGGETEMTNLLPLRLRFHRIKTVTGITFTARPEGGIRVTTPTGYDSDSPPF